MKILAQALIDGREAKGHATIVKAENQHYQLELTDFWVAPGAPDVRIVFSENIDGRIDDSIIEIALLPSGNFNKTIPLEDLSFLPRIKTLIVYCKQFTAHFGHGLLETNILGTSNEV